MPVVQPSVGGKAPELEDGLYAVTCIGVDAKVVENDPYGNNEKLEFHLQLDDKLDEEGEAIVLDPRINLKWNEKSTLYKYAQAFGLNAQPNEPFNTDAFKGKRARALIQTETAGNWPRVKDLMPIKGKAPAKPVAQADDDTDEPDFTAFWKRVRAGGYDREQVAPYVDGDLTTLARKTQNELDKILADMGV